MCNKFLRAFFCVLHELIFVIITAVFPSTEGSLLLGLQYFRFLFVYSQ